MCCHTDRQTKAELLRQFGKRKTLTLWKVLKVSGEAVIADYQYQPDVNRSNYNGRYSLNYPRGIHVYVAHPCGVTDPDYRAIEVVCHRDDLIRVDSKQAVFTKVVIRKAAWRAAGLKAPKAARGKR